VTALDRHSDQLGYWDSPWPVECGGNRRQKARSGRLDAAGSSTEVVTRRSDRWEVMAVRRDPGEWYVGGTMPAFRAEGPRPFGWVQRIDPVSLEPLAESPPLPCGDHVWCGAILVHANGSVYSVNGSHLHRLDPFDLSVEAERRLVNCSHNGMLALPDGSLVTKDLRLSGQGRSTLTRLDPETLETICELLLPEGSMGRIAADGAVVYVPGTEHLFRLVADGDDLVLDLDWQPRYRSADGPQGLAWDVCLSDGWCWLMDNGDIEAVRRIHTTFPNGRFDTVPDLSWRRPSPRSGPQRLLRVRLDDPDCIEHVAPFGTPGGGIIAPPVNVPEHGVAIVWDSVNGGLAGVDASGSPACIDPSGVLAGTPGGEAGTGAFGPLETLWQLPVRATMQPVVFPDSGELVINDFTAAGSDDIVVVDIAAGEVLSRVASGSRIANGMFLSAGDHRDVYYCTTTARARICWS